MNSELPEVEIDAGLKMAIKPGTEESPAELKTMFPVKPPRAKADTSKLARPAASRLTPSYELLASQKSGDAAATAQAAGALADVHVELASCPVVLFQAERSIFVPARGSGTANALALDPA